VGVGRLGLSADPLRHDQLGAKYFGAAFVAEAVLLLVAAVLPGRFALHAGVFRPSAE